ncbi:MAG: T9SS type A sorting domain-containing protein, partial [Bacteroidota bacterium]
GTSAGTTIALSGMLENGNVWVVCDDGSSADLLAEADQTSGSSFFNGDDAVVLTDGATDLDIIGQVGTDPGSEWGGAFCGTQNGSLVKDVTSAGTCPADTDGSDAFDPNVWVGTGNCLPQDDFTDIGLPETALPVELMKFESSKSDYDITLHWESATEILLKEYVLQRSNNGIDFHRFRAVSPNLEKSYTVRDLAPINGVNYYRLKMVDLDGTIEYSSTLAVAFGKEKELVIFPTKVNDIVNISFSGNEEMSELSIFNMQGQKQLEMAINLSTTNQIDLSRLGSGAYIIRVRIGEDIFTERLIKE